MNKVCLKKKKNPLHQEKMWSCPSSCENYQGQTQGLSSSNLLNHNPGRGCLKLLNWYHDHHDHYQHHLYKLYYNYHKPCQRMLNPHKVQWTSNLLKNNNNTYTKNVQCKHKINCKRKRWKRLALECDSIVH